MKISIPNIQKLDKHNENQTYAQLSGFYYNSDGFKEATEIKKVKDSILNIIQSDNINLKILSKQDIKKTNKSTKTANNNNSKIKGTVNITVSKKPQETKSYNNVNNIIYSIHSMVNNDELISSINNIKYTPSNNILYINSWVNFNNSTNTLIPNNFGDDINFSFLKCLTGYTHKLNKNNLNTNFSVIGSILTNSLINNKTQVWGSGLIRKETIKIKPEKIYAVRGPKTREILLKSNIECPEIYGDPALLLPYYYRPYLPKKYKLGIIPHHSNINNKLLDKFKDDKEIKIIDFTNYTDWKNVIKLINQCKFIVSESLHGLIISEAYRIPNIWISFSNINQNFKYEDFFLSINKPAYSSYKVKETTTKEDLLSLYNNYNPTFNIDLKKLINVCPFRLNNINLNNEVKPYTCKTLLCGIGKMENNYIREWVEHHKKLGFDNIVLYDNNDIDGEHFEDVIGDYIDSGFVILKDVRGKQLAQIPSYTDCYNTYKDEYDWIAYFDIDEFLQFENNIKIKSFLSKDIYNDRGINTIRICWKQYTDSGIIKTNGDYSVAKFKDYLPIGSGYSAQTKIIIRTCLNKVEFDSPHGILKDDRVVAVNTKGEFCDNAIMSEKPTWVNAWLNHYRFKTIEEYVLNKMVRLWPTIYGNGGKSILNLSFFFKYNKETKEKRKYALKLLKQYNIDPNE